MYKVFNEENIQRLLSGRLIVEKYDKLDKNDVNFQNCNYELAVLGYPDKRTFISTNRFFCIEEFDRCYRLRNKYVETENLTKDDFCVSGSGCLSRGYPPCAIDTKFIFCLETDQIMRDLKPYYEYEICKEYISEAVKRGIDPSKLFPPQPFVSMSHFQLNPEELTPLYCFGKMIKINEPRFDIYWRFEKYTVFAKFQWDLRKNLYEKGI